MEKPICTGGRYMCPICRKFFCTMDFLISHQKYHIRTNCENDIVYSKRTFAIRNVSKFIRKKSALYCVNCGTYCNNMDEVVYHCYMFHNEYFCKVCRKKYPSSEDLKEHYCEPKLVDDKYTVFK